MVAEQRKGEHGLNDVSQWGEKDTSGAYPPGTRFVIGGEKIDPSRVPDVVGGKMRKRDRRRRRVAGS